MLELCLTKCELMSIGYSGANCNAFSVYTANSVGFSNTPLSCACVTAEGVWRMYGTIRTLQKCLLISHNSCFTQLSAYRVTPSCPEAVVPRESIIGLNDETIHRVNRSFTPDYPTIFIHKFIAHKCFITNA